MGLLLLRDRIDDAKRHGHLQLSLARLERCPSLVVSEPELCATLWRLDLSGNRLETLPDAIGALSALRVLWVNHNPRLTTLPAALARCARLEVLDASASALQALPSELGALERLRVVDIGATPLERRWLDKKVLSPVAEAATNHDDDDELRHAAAVATRGREIGAKLRRKAERERLKRELLVKLHDDVYRLERARPQDADALRAAIQRLLKRFPLADDVRSVIRNAERLFPAAFSADALRAVDPTAFREAFDRLRADTERKKRAADLELKLRSLYFDRVEPPAVERMLRSIGAEIRDLGELKFLLQHARALFPREPADVDGAELRRRLLALQDELARERSAAIAKVEAAARAIYSDVDPEQVVQLVARVAALFKNTKDLRSLAADASSLFPAEFLLAQPSDIRAAFVALKASALGTSSTAAASNTTLATSSSSPSRSRRR
ncbi:hypothetical protein ATCC90586_009316 [Pythium insidiosum]|nr:hypothetical protein ATCC90586_009316 [Pythium insidiosum]